MRQRLDRRSLQVRRHIRDKRLLLRRKLFDDKLLRRRGAALLFREHLHRVRLRLQHNLATLPAVRRVRRADVLRRQHLHWRGLVMQHDRQPAEMLRSVRRRGAALLRRKQLHSIRLRLQHCVANLCYMRRRESAVLQRNCEVRIRCRDGVLVGNMQAMRECNRFSLLRRFERKPNRRSFWLVYRCFRVRSLL